MRFCCDERCNQGRDCPDRTVPDWFDGFALGICAVTVVIVLLMLFA